VRDQGPGPRDGSDQGGRYYVFEVGDRWEVGVWRREGDHWVDLLPWSRSVAVILAVRPGNEPNELKVRAIRDQFSFDVNGIQVYYRTDAALENGGVVVFAGGDFNSVLLTNFRVEDPSP